MTMKNVYILRVVLMFGFTALSALAADYKADFSSGLDDGWSFVREDKTQWRLQDGNIELLAQPTNIWGKKNNKTKNFLLRDFPGEAFTVEVTVEFNPRKEYEQAGLMIYMDDDNYIKFDRELYAGQSCTLVLESGAKPKVIKKIAFREGPLRLRLEIAQQREVSAFVIFGDKSLVDMASRKPANESEFGDIFGVGEAKLKDFAAPFLAEIANFSAGS